MLEFSRAGCSTAQTSIAAPFNLVAWLASTSIHQRVTARIKKIANLPATHRGPSRYRRPRNALPHYILLGNHTTPAAFGRSSLFPRRRSALFYFPFPPTQHVAIPGARLNTLPSLHQSCACSSDATTPLHPPRVVIHVRFRIGPRLHRCRHRLPTLVFWTRQPLTLHPSFISAPRRNAPLGSYKPLACDSRPPDMPSH